MNKRHFLAETTNKRRQEKKIEQEMKELKHTVTLAFDLWKVHETQKTDDNHSNGNLHDFLTISGRNEEKHMFLGLI